MANNHYVIDKLLSYIHWTFEGVDMSLAGNGGEECINFIPRRQKIIESAIFITISFLEICWAYPRMKLPSYIPPTERTVDRLGKRIFLVIMCLTFGVELGYKFSTRQMIWILNPCHVVTMMQIYLLVAVPSPFTMRLFRVMMHCLSGATIALIFPVVNTRLLPFETETYYIQHALMLIVPYYLMRVGGAYTPEPLSNYTYVFMAIGSLFFYHWTLMQGLAIITGVNMNNMVCPAISDPFYGRWYRVAAFSHQHIVFCLHGKLYTVISQLFLPKRAAEAKEYNNSTINDSNGHAKVH